MTLGYGEDTREYLLGPDDEQTRIVPQCPVLAIQIDGVEVRALIDTGSQVSAVSESFYSANIGRFSKCPTLPLVGVTVTSATEKKATKVSRQFYANVHLQQVEEASTILVVPKLTVDCIIGIDILSRLKTKIDLENYELIFADPCNPTRTHRLRFTNPPSVEEQSTPMRHMIKNNCNEELVTDTEIEAKVASTLWSTEKERSTFIQLLKKHRRVFDKKPGRLTTYEHDLKVIPHNSFQAHSYPIPIAYRDSVDAEINRMLALGVIQRSKSPYCNPILVVIKKDNSVRLCLDARRINEILQPDNEQMETPEILFQECTGMPFISSLDLTSSFWQIPLTQRSRKYTAFTHRGKCYEFCVTPFGLRTSTASLVRGLQPVLSGLNNIINFVDDLLCMSETFEQHLEDLDDLFTRFHEHGLTINLNKSSFFRSEVKFLGHILTPKGIKPDPDKVKAIHEYPSPRNIKQLRGFFGLVNYYSKFTSRHASATVPLLDLIRKGVKWKWGEAEEMYFKNIKELFCNEVILRYPDKNRPFYIETDASEYALGAVLCQKDDSGEMGVLQFASRTLKGAEIGYFTTEKELLAIVWALQKFRSYILGSKVITTTDHAALTFLKECKLAHARLTRWTLAIQDYDMEVRHCPGEKNIVADTLSRPANPDIRENKQEVVIAALACGVTTELEALLTNLAEIQRRDASTNEIISSLENKIEVRNYQLKKEILYKNIGDTLRAVIPKQEVGKIITACHEMYGHAGAKKCYMIMRDDFYCKNLYRLTRVLIRTCESCQKNKVYTKGSFAEARSILPERPGDLVSLDFYGPLPTARYRMKHVLAIIDVFSKLIRLYPLQSATADATIRCLTNDYIPRFGKPKAALSDQGTQFTGEKWKNALEKLNIQRILTSIRHPQANPVERTNRELSRFFRTFLKTKHTAWTEYLTTIESCINEMHHETTGCIPILLHTGKQPEKPWEHLLRKPADLSTAVISQEDWIKLAQKNMRERRGKQTSEFNSKHRQTKYAVGDRVLVKALNVSNPEKKLIAKFMQLYEGPYEVQKVVWESSYIVKNIHNDKVRGQYHTRDIRPYYEPVRQ